MKTQKPLLTWKELRYILEDVPFGKLSRDELTHACEQLGIQVCSNDTNEELVYYLKEELQLT